MVATAGERRVRVDLAGVEHCDLAGLRAMISLAYTGDGRVSLEQVVLAHLPGSLRTALRILGWDAAPGLILEEGACWT
jgi:ABC-type transporter Mla MlaB component